MTRHKICRKLDYLLWLIDSKLFAVSRCVTKLINELQTGITVKILKFLKFLAKTY